MKFRDLVGPKLVLVNSRTLAGDYEVWDLISSDGGHKDQQDGQ